MTILLIHVCQQLPKSATKKIRSKILSPVIFHSQKLSTFHRHPKWNETVRLPNQFHRKRRTLNERFAQACNNYPARVKCRRGKKKGGRVDPVAAP